MLQSTRCYLAKGDTRRAGTGGNQSLQANSELSYFVIRLVHHIDLVPPQGPHIINMIDKGEVVKSDSRASSFFD